MTGAAPVSYRAELPAVVLMSVARVGQHVVPGDVLVLLESMKMEMPVVVEHEGFVLQVSPVGSRVLAGDVVAELRLASS